jgi:hypothetical protein
MAAFCPAFKGKRWSTARRHFGVTSLLDLVLTFAHVSGNLAFSRCSLDGCEEMACLMWVLLHADKFLGRGRGVG